jgi:hypothetical protein
MLALTDDKDCPACVATLFWVLYGFFPASPEVVALDIAKQGCCANHAELLESIQRRQHDSGDQYSGKH